MSNHYLGFDLGHADTAIALLGSAEHGRQAMPVSLEMLGQTIQPTALAHVQEGQNVSTLIGSRAIREASRLAEGHATRFRAAFKTRPRDLGGAEDDIRDFFAGCLRDVTFDPIQPEGWAAVAIAVGCPSSWSADDDAALYKTILADGLASSIAAGAALDVVPESRAALLQAIDNPSSPLTMAARKENILVIDIGSSTLDFSLIAPEQKAAPLLDAGIDLGASFFDRRLLAAILSDEPAAVEFLQHNPHYKDLWLYYARRTKEQFFLDNPSGEAEYVSGAPLQSYFSGGKKKTLAFDVSGPMFAALRTEAYDHELHPSPELHLDPLMLKGKSWEHIYEASLRALKEAIHRRGTGYGQILLAGGASRMPFTKTIAEEVFQETDRPSTVLRDPEPSHMVSRGLARWGRKRNSIELFSAKARRLLSDRLPTLLVKHFDELNEDLSAGLADTIFVRVVVPVLDQWKGGAFKTGQDVRSEVERAYRTWIQSDEAHTFFVETINRWWRREVRHEIEVDLDRLHTTYDVSKDIQLHLNHAIDPDSLAFTTQKIDLPFETVIQATLLTLAYAVAVSADVLIGGIPLVTGGLTAAVAIGGRWTKRWISNLDVPGFARKLPDRLPGRGELFNNQIRKKVEKELRKSIESARESLIDQVEAGVLDSIDRQTKRTRMLLYGSNASQH